MQSMSEIKTPPTDDRTLTFTAPVGLIVRSFVFFVGALGVTGMAGVGISATEGFQQLLLGITTVFPFLVTLATGLQLASVLSRRITLTSDQLVHQQLFKHYLVPLSSVKWLETLHDEDGQVLTLRVRWYGTPFYIDAAGLKDFEVFLTYLSARVSPELRRRVEAFEPVT